MFSGVMILLVLGVLLVYFLPGIVAESRQHPNHWLIFFVTLLTGWTVIGWVACLIWSLSSPVPNAPRRPGIFDQEMACIHCAGALPDDATLCTWCGKSPGFKPRPLGRSDSALSLTVGRPPAGAAGFCPHCGAPRAEGPFCPSCGAKLS
jgi:hypothetical protein